MQTLTNVKQPHDVLPMAVPSEPGNATFGLRPNNIQIIYITRIKFGIFSYSEYFCAWKRSRRDL